MTSGPEGPSAFARDAHAKALSINLDPSIYGSFAEIGAGQEVARLFLSAGGAAGTVAQTISAYDKVFSDSTYCEGTRYVSRERLLAMLDHEALLRALEPHSTRCRIADSAGALITADDLILEPPANHLYRYLREGRWVLPVEPA